MPLTVPAFIYGTMTLGHDQVPFDQRLAMARYAMDHCTWFHTSHKYGSTIDVLKVAFAERPNKVPQCTFKLGGDTLDEVKGQIDHQLNTLGVSKMGLGQLHVGGALAADFVAGGKSLDGLRQLRDQRLVGGWVLEVHPWTSAIALAHLKSGTGHDVIDGYTFYYNPLQRYALNDLFALITEKRRPILALRSVAGGPIDKQAARPADPKDFMGQRARQLLATYRKSGFTDWTEFCMAYVLNQPNVVTTIGACSSPAHLDALVAGAHQKGKGFPDHLAQEIAALQTQWSDANDRHAAEWTM